MAELEQTRNQPVSARGHTALHELLATLVDQIVELRLITAAWINTQIRFDGEPPSGKRYVARPDSPIELAKQLKLDRERVGLDDWYERLMRQNQQEVNHG